MKIKQGKSVPVEWIEEEGCWVTASRTDDLLVLDCFKDGEAKGRYLMNIETGEYGILRGESYSADKLVRAFANNCWSYWEVRNINCTEADEALIRETLKEKSRYRTGYSIGSLMEKTVK